MPELQCRHEVLTRPLGKKTPMPLGSPRVRMLMICWGVRLRVRPRMSVGMRFTKPSGTAMKRGSVLTMPWSSSCAAREMTLQQWSIEAQTRHSASGHCSCPHHLSAWFGDMHAVDMLQQPGI